MADPFSKLLCQWYYEWHGQQAGTCSNSSLELLESASMPLIKKWQGVRSGAGLIACYGMRLEFRQPGVHCFCGEFLPQPVMHLSGYGGPAYFHAKYEDTFGGAWKGLGFLNRP